MTKLLQINYYNKKGEKKINCYSVYLTKQIVEQAKIEKQDTLNIYVEKERIIIEKQK